MLMLVLDGLSKSRLDSSLLLDLVDFIVLFPVTFTLDDIHWNIWDKEANSHLKHHHEVFENDNDDKELNQFQMCYRFFRWTKLLESNLIRHDEKFSVNLTREVHTS